MRFVLAAIVCLGAIPAWGQANNYVVLPFFNASADKSLDWIGESLAENITDTLASEGIVMLDRDDRVEVYRRLSLRPYTVLTKASVLKAGEMLDAEQVIYGQFDLKPATDLATKSRGTLQISARILSLRHMKEGPEFHEVGALEDLAALQNHLAWQTLQFVKPKGAPSEAEFRARRPSIRVDAIENYIRGLLATNTDDKHRLLTQALRLDPQYSSPCLQLGRLDWKKKDYKSAADWFQKVPPTDIHYHEASFFLGLSRYYMGDFPGAQTALQGVAGAVPLNEVFNDLGAAQSRQNSPAALDNFRKAMEGDQSDPVYQFNVGYGLWKQGKFPEAAEKFRFVLERNPSDAVAKMLLERSQNSSGPRATDTRTEGLERLKTNYEESQYWQLKALLQPQKP